VTDEEVAYFRDHPDQIDEVTAPVIVHKLFLWVGAFLGALFVGISKVIKFSQLALLSEGVREFTVDIVFEIGVALIGAAVTAYILGILLNQQQDNAATWRSEIRRRISEPAS
jgi:predicted membrane-bound spermidine synthase